MLLLDWIVQGKPTEVTQDSRSFVRDKKIVGSGRNWDALSIIVVLSQWSDSHFESLEIWYFLVGGGCKKSVEMEPYFQAYVTK